MLSRILIASCALTVALSAPAPPESFLEPQQQLTFSNQAASASSFSLPLLSSLSLPSDQLSQLKSHIESLPERRLVQLNVAGEQVEISEGEKALLVYQGVKFVDVTEEVTFLTTQEKETYPSKLSYSTKMLDPLFATIDLEEMKAFLVQFSSYYTRYFRSATGKESQAYLLSYLKEIAKSNENIDITFSEVVHSWGQNSIIARFNPTTPSKKQRLDIESKSEEKIVILGAHQDSTSFLPFLRSFGADDDGSGCTTLVTAFRSLVNATFAPSTNPVEFHFYSAEEGGLLGSQAVAQEYAAKGKKIRAMLQMDMTAFVKEGTKPTIGVITDFVDADLTSYIKLIVGEYATIGFTETKCGYACSDHASWSKIGAPSAFTIESTFEESNHQIHSGNDRIDYSPEFSFEHIREFTRLAIGLAVELGGGKSLE